MRLGARTIAGLAALLAVTVLVCAPAGRSAVAGNVHLFGTNETASSDISAFSKWTDMLTRLGAETNIETDCAHGVEAACRMRAWDAFLEQIRNRHPREQIAAVNHLLNRERYVPDRSNYGTEDYWATPTQFFGNQGDCEDFAITKYVSLKTLGFAPSQMRIVIVQDLTTGAPHAVLVVYMDDEALVLDNRSEAVLTHDRLSNYRPFYSLNEDGWWLHSG